MVRFGDHHYAKNAAMEPTVSWNLKPAKPKQNGEVILARFLSTDFVGARTIPTCTLPLAPPGTAVRRNGARRPNKSMGSEQCPRLRRHGDYLLGKVGKVFPHLRAKVF